MIDSIKTLICDDIRVSNKIFYNEELISLSQRISIRRLEFDRGFVSDWKSSVQFLATSLAKFLDFHRQENGSRVIFVGVGGSRLNSIGMYKRFWKSGSVPKIDNYEWELGPEIVLNQSEKTILFATYAFARTNDISCLADWIRETDSGVFLLKPTEFNFSEQWLRDYAASVFVSHDTKEYEAVPVQSLDIMAAISKMQCSGEAVITIDGSHDDQICGVNIFQLHK